MKVYFKNQKNRLTMHLNALKKNTITTYNLNTLEEKSSTIDISTENQLSKHHLNCLFDYKIFPDYIMTAFSQWKHEKRKMEVGDTIVQQIFIPPFKYFSLKLIIGVRINHIIDEPNRVGFAYETLEGHIEKGKSIFTVERADEKAPLVFKIHTYSKPNSILTRLLAPIISIPYQKFCTNQALENIKNKYSNRNK